MPGGIGRVSETMLSDSTRKQRAIGTVSNANEIFYNLDSRRVFYDRAERQLYFVAAPDERVLRTIMTALGGLHSPLAVEQLHLDAHRFFTGARRVRLSEQQATVVLVALRLAGVRATVR